MPTVILLDVSLSMSRTSNPSGDDPVQVKTLANVGISTLLNYFAQNALLEHAALIVFSSLWEIRSEFTRNHASIQDGIYDLELYDKSNIVNAIRGALSLKLNEWSQNGAINIILITDGQLYHESMSEGLSDGVEETKFQPNKNAPFRDIPLSELEDQIDFPCKIQVVCLTSPRDPALKHSITFYKNLIYAIDSSSTDCPVLNVNNMRNFKQSAIWLPESNTLDITVESVENLFSHIAELHYKPYHTVLSCGHLSSMVMLSPKPLECLLEPLKNEFDDLKTEESSMDKDKETFVSTINKVRLYKLANEINICGFLPLSEIASPAITSRHIVLAIPSDKFNETSKAEQILSQDPNAYCKSIQTCPLDDAPTNALNRFRADKILKQSDVSGPDKQPSKHAPEGNDLIIDQEIVKQPSFCVLLHNCLKQENMVAICIVGKNEESNDDWYGMLHHHTDSKKRSSLMLSLFIPGPSPVLWLPTFKSMGSSSMNADLPPMIRDRITNNRGPLKSYSSNNVIWLDPESVQADVQKIVRHAKRAPDKAPHFYKELNRIRKAAISYGFYDVLFGLAATLEREKRVMKMDQSKGVDQEVMNHIDHVITCLRADLTEDCYDTHIQPPI